MTGMFLLMKRGLYWRPEGKGYTGIKEEAGRYTLDECARYFPNTDSPDQDGTSFIAEDDAPDYSPNCCSGIKSRHIQARIEQLEAELKSAEITISNLCDAQDAIRRTAHNDAIEAAAQAISKGAWGLSVNGAADLIRALKRTTQEQPK